MRKRDYSIVPIVLACVMGVALFVFSIYAHWKLPSATIPADSLEGFAIRLRAGTIAPASAATALEGAAGVLRAGQQVASAGADMMTASGVIFLMVADMDGLLYLKRRRGDS
jgi:hypothetical protein